MTDKNIHFLILEDIARELSGDVNFPTCLDAALLIRDTLKDPMVDLERVVQVVSVEPLLSSKLLRLANSVNYNPSGQPIAELGRAVSRIGFDNVRTLSLALAMDQMLKSRNLAAYDDIAHRAWEHSIHVAAICRVLAKHIGRHKPDEAMLLGLVHDMGVFYLLYRAVAYPEYRNNRDAMLDLLRGWHEPIGESLLFALGVPERIASALQDHDRIQNIETPSSLHDLLYFANLLATGDEEWNPGDSTPESQSLREIDRARYAPLVAEADEDINTLRAALRI
ncbi:MAG: HDOD domain-containing protein [Dechloromonas sp.]|nr:HDOD domain-containing protein [Dechloromonas sp.]